MIADSTAYALAHDLALFRAIYHAALDVIAQQQRQIAELEAGKIRLHEELRARMGVTT